MLNVYRVDINGVQYVPLVEVIDKVARKLMQEICPFSGVSGDFDVCSLLTRQTYEQQAAELFGLSLKEYYELRGDD